ncbi:hypothetical protein RHGRI_002643 [Rhododendron griersonianum]|uniref:Myb-like domain-containing protein n=1 Tax=Rhododendron griersonianum TaxID=479676 RepID=A0AAV6LSU0_9ERIC|nr:hypothetical protein RHGRI_002643 [Rhododendron griersonianum]
MAASAHPSGNNQEASGHANGTASNGCSVPHDNAVVGPTQAALRHNPGLAVEWTADEQSLLEELLTTFASEHNIVRYAKVAMQLKDKTVRDVALRCRWLTKKENGKRRKEDHNSSRKNKDRKEKVTDPLSKSVSHAVNRTNGPPYAQSMLSMENDDGISFTDIGGLTGQLLEENAQALDQIYANFASFKMHENANLFCQARNNILAILNDMNDMPEIMKHMPPLPVNLNEELASSVLHMSPLQKNS